MTGIVFDSLLPGRIVTLISVGVGAIIYGLLIIKQQYLDQAEISQIPVLQKSKNLLVKK